MISLFLKYLIAYAKMMCSVALTIHYLLITHEAVYIVGSEIDSFQGKDMNFQINLPGHSLPNAQLFLN